MLIEDGVIEIGSWRDVERPRRSARSARVPATLTGVLQTRLDSPRAGRAEGPAAGLGDRTGILGRRSGSAGRHRSRWTSTGRCST